MTRVKDRRPVASAERKKTSRRGDWILGGLLFAATLLIYAQVWEFGFVTVDDSAYVPGNPYVLQGLTPRSVIWSWTAVHDSNWIPFTWLSLMLDTNLYHGRPGGYHVTNALLHAVNTVLLFVALLMATGARGKSAVVAALFALHPLHVESVAWVAERKDVLSTLFGFLSIAAYVRYATRGGWKWLAASVGFLVGSLLSKQTLVTLPFVLLLLDYWPLGRLRLATAGLANPAKAIASAKGAARTRARGREEMAPTLWPIPERQQLVRRLVLEKLPFFVVSALFCGVALLAQSKSGAVMSLKGLPFGVRVTNAIVVYVAYLGKTLFPQNLAVYYPHPHEQLTWTVVGLAAGLLVAISAAAVIFVRRFPYVFVGWFWYVGTLVPVIGLVQIGSQQMADRYTYVPLVGLFLAVTWLIPVLVPEGTLRTRLLPVATVAALLLLAATTFSQITYWHDSVTLLRHSMECTPDNSVAHEFLGSAYITEGAYQEGIDELQKAIQMVPAYAPLHVDRAAALQQLGRLEEAAAEFREALALEPQSAETRTNLGYVLFRLHHNEEAREQYLHALEIDPNYVPAHMNLAALCLMGKDLTGALRHSEDALRLQPNLPGAEMCLGMVLREQQHLDESIRHFERVLEMTPGDSIARDELERTRAMKNAPPQKPAAKEAPAKETSGKSPIPKSPASKDAKAP
jgi:protein O-mannosyl-transferase